MDHLINVLTVIDFLADKVSKVVMMTTGDQSAEYHDLKKQMAEYELMLKSYMPAEIAYGKLRVVEAKLKHEYELLLEFSPLTAGHMRKRYMEAKDAADDAELAM